MVRPLLVFLLSIDLAFLAKLADDFDISRHVFDLSQDSIETLLQIMSASMLVIATLTAATIMSAYALYPLIEVPERSLNDREIALQLPEKLALLRGVAGFAEGAT